MTVFIRSFSSWGNCAHLNSWLTLQTLSLSFQLIFLMSGSDRLFWFSCWNMRHKEYRGIRKIIFPVEFYFSMLLLFLRDARVLLCPFVSFYLPQCVQGSACSCAEAERRGSSYAILYQPAPIWAHDPTPRNKKYISGRLALPPCVRQHTGSRTSPLLLPAAGEEHTRTRAGFPAAEFSGPRLLRHLPDDRDTKSPRGIVLNLLHPNRDSHLSIFPYLPGKPCGSTGSCFEIILSA